MFVAELGDKTELTTLTLTTTQEPIATSLGSTVEVVADDELAVGTGIAQRVLPNVNRAFAATSLEIFGYIPIHEGIGQK